MTTSSPVPPPPPTVGTFNSNDKLWSVFSHLSFFVGVGLFAFIFPLAVYLVARSDSPYITHHARAALNFHLSLLLYGLICLPLCFIGVGVIGLVLVGVVGIVCSIVAAVHASKGTYYSYPVTIQFVR